MGSRRLTVLLVVSLALNLFLVGTVLGGLVVGRRMQGEGPTPRAGGPPLWSAARGLSEDQRHAYGELLRDREIRAELRSARLARAEAWRRLGAEPFDAEGARRALAEARAKELAARTAMEDRIVDFAGDLSAGDRARFAEALGRPPHRMKHRSDERP
ncbi:MAG: periplasmic heavy metal sensor [Phenylobacterium sp.]|uniref:periplasmic heavy metal sensor n=1 Tax=Phenylobacterium sp. TaxID=1871053 RepID=UPI003919F6AB